MFLEAVRDDNGTPLPKAAVLGLLEMHVVLQISAMAHLTTYSHGTSLIKFAGSTRSRSSGNTPL
jgi:hypothetical protein